MTRGGAFLRCRVPGRPVAGLTPVSQAESLLVDGDGQGSGRRIGTACGLLVFSDDRITAINTATAATAATSSQRYKRFATEPSLHRSCR